MDVAGHVGAPWLEVRGLSKRYGGVQALRDVDLQISRGEVHGLVGANGAGKSTLIKMLAGLDIPDSGQILVDGAPVEIDAPGVATKLGFRFIHQELNLVPKFNALENMTLGQPKPKRFGLIDWQQVQRNARDVAQRLNFRFRLDVPVEDLSVADQWLITIGRALLLQARLIAMDEPTASLSDEESERLFAIVRDLAAEGIAVLYVSHRLDEILQLCDNVSVFKDGRKVLRTSRAEMTKNSLVESIVGGALRAPEPREPDPSDVGDVVLDVRNLRRGMAVRDVSFQLRRGEVLGLAGLVGAGRTELARLIFGADQADGGDIMLRGERLSLRGPQDAVRHGIGLVPEERRAQGVVLDQSVSFNINLPSLRSVRVLPHLPLVRLRRARERARRISDEIGVKTDSIERAVGALSGGNQQKVVIGKWLTRDLQVLILDEPSRGVDIGARSEIHRLIRQLADGGAGVIVISSELEELEGFCDRVLVMVEGRVVGELVGDDITEEKMLSMSYEHDQALAGGGSR
jgi:ribose transport system ATP-binding protein